MSQNYAPRRLTLGLVGVVVVVALAVAAVIYWNSGRPSASSPAGSAPSTTDQTPLDVKDPLVTVPSPAIKPFTESPKAPTAQGIAAHLGPLLGNPKLGDLAGVIMDPVSGAVLWKKDQADPRIPASTAKLLTAAALLTSTNPDGRLATRVVQGARPGDIVFVGGGDVTLSARQAGTATVYPGAPTVADLAAQVKATDAQVKRIILDTGYWSGPDLAQGWDITDIRGTPQARQGYITRMSALMVDGDRDNPAEEYSPRTGDPAKTAGKALALALGVPNAPLVDGTAPPKAKVLGEVYSQPYSVLLAQALVNSDNTLADALARQVAIARGAPPTFQGASAATIEALQKNLHIDTVGVQLFDGSGMSTDDRVPPDVLAQILSQTVTGKIPALRSMLAGLPVAGVSGTLQDRYAQPSSKAGAGWVRAKTGSLQVTSAEAGYVPSVDGRILVFVLNSNGSVGDPTRYAQDDVGAALRTCGCR